MLFGKTLQTFARKLVCGICFTAHITDNAPTATTSFANFVHSGPKAVARWHATADHWSAIRAHDHSVIRPPRGREVERSGADMRLQLRRSAHVRKAERLRVDGTPSNKNGQATSGPALLVQRGVHVDHQALPQTAFLPFLAVLVPGVRTPGRRVAEEPNTMLRACPQMSTTSGAYHYLSRRAAARSPSRGSHRRRAGARRWSCPGGSTGERQPPARQAICPACSSRVGPCSPTLPRNL